MSDFREKLSEVCTTKIVKYAFGITTGIFTFAPESFFKMCQLIPGASETVDIIVGRFTLALVIFLMVLIKKLWNLETQRFTIINGTNYSVKILYGNIFDVKKGKKIIPFDECFTVNVGDKPENINPSSVCGQYIQKYSLNKSIMDELIKKSHLQKLSTDSMYHNMNRYESGKLVVNGDYLLMAFAKLDGSGKGYLSYNDYLKCLTVLWDEIDKYYGGEDVYIPILGSGVTRMDGSDDMTSQELLEIIITSYKLAPHKIHLPQQLKIICKKESGISLAKIDNQYNFK